MKEIDFEKVYDYNSGGAFRIVKDLGVLDGKRWVIIRFENPNIFGFRSETKIPLYMVEHNNIRDPYNVSLCGHGCVGNVKSATSVYRYEYNAWQNMIVNCYGKGDSGNTVCTRWRCFEFFLQDITKIENYNDFINDPENYSLIKDQSSTEYNLQTALFLPRRMTNKLFTKNKSIYKGVYDIDEHNYMCKVDNINYGIFPTAEYAASMANNIMLEQGYPLRVLNPVPEMSIEALSEIRIKNPKSSDRRPKKMKLYKIVRSVNESRDLDDFINNEIRYQNQLRDLYD